MLLLQIDSKISLGNLLTMGVMLVGCIGAFYTIKIGLKNTQDQLEKGQKETAERLDRIAAEISGIKTEYQTKELDKAREEAMVVRIEDMARRIASLEGRPSDPPKPRRVR